MLPDNQQVVSPERFDDLLREQAKVAEFLTKEAEEEYLQHHAFLIHLVRREVAKHFGMESDCSPSVGDDCWPDHTSHISVTPRHCTQSFLTALRSLLTDDDRDYRIQLCVYGDIMDGKTYIGSMALWADRVLIERNLHELLCSQRNATQP